MGRESNGFPMPRWAGWSPDMPRRVLGRNSGVPRQGWSRAHIDSPRDGNWDGDGDGDGVPAGGSVAVDFLTRILGSSLWELLN